MEIFVLANKAVFKFCVISSKIILLLFCCFKEASWTPALMSAKKPRTFFSQRFHWGVIMKKCEENKKRKPKKQNPQCLCTEDVVPQESK